ncbi:MAG: diguanylate cyclase [Thiomicrorhabdus sp.]|nr:MAG: diguanylate cyclase [Thiomicrorhabdus sp.]
MLELSSAVKEPITKVTSSPEVERFMQTKRARAEDMAERGTLTADSSVKKMLQMLQDRFSHTDDVLPNEIESLIEEQVKVRTGELFRQANYDALTHLPNRAYFHRTLEQLIKEAKGSDTEFTLLFLDLDGFKNVNDTYGHHAGDELLRNAGARLVSCVREGDIVSRLGGDEFVILLAGLSEREVTENICQRIISEISRSYWINKNDVQISTSIGVARYPEDAQTSSQLVENSDKALYVSKDSGRSTYRFYADIAATVAESTDDLQSHLEMAFKNNQVQSCFEPTVDLVSQNIVGATVSALWMDELIDNPYLSAWTEVLNQSSWGVSAGRWLMDSGLFYLQQWQQVEADFSISIPVVDALWQSEDIVSRLADRIAYYQVKADNIQLEFSMQTIVQEGAQAVLSNLSDAGYKITLTGVGKDALDIAQLMAFNVNEIKLDAQWLQNAMTTAKGRQWVRAVIRMVQSVDIRVVAVGVEQKKEANILASMGCTVAQGSKWSQPLCATEFYKALSSQLPEIH